MSKIYKYSFLCYLHFSTTMELYVCLLESCSQIILAKEHTDRKHFNDSARTFTPPYAVLAY